MKRDPRFIVALDVTSYRKAARLVKQLAPYVKVFKIGSALFTKYGPRIIKYIHKKGAKVFLDLKFHDIPNTVASAAVEATRLGVYMMNVHATSGAKTMHLTAEKVSEEAAKLKVFKPILIAVTVLTSLNEDDLRDIGAKGSVEDLVLKLADLAKKSGMDGVVASGKETKVLKKKFGENFVVVTPGIRPTWAKETGDQKRVMTPREAIDSGSDFIVVGRPVLDSHKPVKAVKDILKEIA